jgi:DNA-binding protein HU-beta
VKVFPYAWRVFFWLTALERLDRLPLVLPHPATQLFVHEYSWSLSEVNKGPFTVFHHLRFFKEVTRMAKSMTKSQIADYLAQKTGLTKKASVQLMDDFAALAYKEAKNVFVIPGIGKLVLANRKARMGRNPQTGEAIKIPAKRVVKFRVAKAAKDAILGKK